MQTPHRGDHVTTATLFKIGHKKLLEDVLQTCPHASQSVMGYLCLSIQTACLEQRWKHLDTVCYVVIVITGYITSDKCFQQIFKDSVNLFLIEGHDHKRTPPPPLPRGFFIPCGQTLEALFIFCFQTFTASNVMV